MSTRREESMIELLDRSENSVVGVRISGKVTEEDYERILPELEQRIAEHGEIAILCRFDGWSGIEPEAIWRDVRFYSTHFQNVRRFAVVQDRPWQGTMTRVVGPLTGAETRVFEGEEEDDAWKWLFRKAEADRAWTDADAGRRHAGRYRKRVHELVSDLREDAERLLDRQAKAVFETSAEVLAAVEKSLSYYERESGSSSDRDPDTGERPPPSNGSPAEGGAEPTGGDAASSSSFP